MGCASSRASVDGTFEPSFLASKLAVKQKTDFKALPIDPVKSPAKILVVCTDDGKFKMINGKFFSSGNHPVETFVPLLHFKAAGFSFEFATVSAGPVVFEMWAFPTKDEAVTALHKELNHLYQVPKKLEDVDASLAGYAGIFIPGGHGAMVNLPESVALGKLLHAAHAAEIPTISLCHGPAALLAAAKVEGAEFPYKGYKMVSFSDGTDKMGQKIGYIPGAMPWLMQEALKAQGAEVTNKSEKGEVLVDRELITGDSPAAANKLGQVAAPILVASWSKRG
mmetsp:Transcript_6831/g.14840  ORF Transcript_6831/g.14840 Transcript_6831/m.14840 type:complete len:280 (+) Transcript_6831:71-910(+)